MVRQRSLSMGLKIGLEGQGMKIGVMLRHIAEKGGIVVYTSHLLHTLLQLDTTNQYVLMYQNPKDLGHFADYPNAVETVVSAPNKLFWDQIAVPHFAKKNQLDIIYNPKLSIPLLTRCKTVWVMHGGAQAVVPHLFKRFDRLYFKWANKIYAKRATAIITMTYLGAQDIINYMGADEQKIHVIHEAFNPLCQLLDRTATQKVQAKYQLPDPFILFVGGLSPLKNFSNLLQAYHRLQADIAHQLVVVGFNRWKFSGDLDLVDQLGLRDRVRFIGFVPDEEIPAFYNLADLFVFPSLYEGFGIPILEAMACGCPVVTSKTGCGPEVAGEAALLVDPYSPADIAQAIYTLLTDEPLRQALKEQGVKRAEQFSWHKCAQQTLALFQSL